MPRNTPHPPVADLRKSLERGQATLYIHRFDDLEPGDLVVLCCRVSTHEQATLPTQVRRLRLRVKACGGIVVGVVRHVGSGYDPWWLAEAVRKARQHGAKYLLAMTTDRFIRSRLYSKQDQDEQARAHELEDLKVCTDGLPLMTFLHPDATPSECRSLQTRWNRPGRRKETIRPGETKRLKEQLLPKVRRLREQGASWSDIAAETGVSASTVRGWLAADEKPT